MGKLEARSFRAHFIGYPKETMGYYYILEDHNVIVSHHAVFLEKSLSKMEAVGGRLSSKKKFLKSIESENLNPVTS